MNLNESLNPEAELRTNCNTEQEKKSEKSKKPDL